MLLLIDIGNSSTTIGFDTNGEIRHILRLKTVARGRSAEEYFYYLKGYLQHNQLQKPAGAAVCSVVPGVTPSLMTAIKKGFGIRPVEVTQNVKTGLKFLIKKRVALGADRIANAVAARSQYKGNVIVVDFGTATTFCVISSKGEYRGGAIMPGLLSSTEALSEKTAKLPLIELKAPENVLGKDTIENIRAGVIIGHAGAVERIIREIKRETGKTYTVLATGGLAGHVNTYIKEIDHLDPLLTLKGLKIIYKMNS